MKRRLLFIIPGLSAGGGEKSLVNLLSHIDFDRYEVDLFMFHHEGLFLDYLPKEIRILPLPDPYKYFSLPLLRSIKTLISKGMPAYVYHRIMFAIHSRSSANTSIREQRAWRYMAPLLHELDQSYDAAIGFLEKTATYFCVDKVQAACKLGWVHIDYDKLGMDPGFDIHYFRKLDAIVTVSEECANVLTKRFPSETDKVKVIYNIVSPGMIRRMADQETSVFNVQAGESVILTIGRLHPQKGLELAVEACRLLLDRGHRLKWYVIGEGDDRGKLERLIRQHGVEGSFVLLGLRANPYPYLKQADLYAQTSRYEGKSIAIDEAKILRKPILATNFSTAKDQIRHGENGWIVDMEAEAIAAGVERLLSDSALRNKLVQNLSMLNLGTEQEIEKLYSLVN